MRAWSTLVPSQDILLPFKAQSGQFRSSRSQGSQFALVLRLSFGAHEETVMTRDFHLSYKQKWSELTKQNIRPRKRLKEEVRNSTEPNQSFSKRWENCPYDLLLLILDAHVILSKPIVFDLHNCCISSYTGYAPGLNPAVFRTLKSASPHTIRSFYSKNTFAFTD